MCTFTKIRLSYRALPVSPHDTAAMLGYDGRLPDDILVMVEDVMGETADCFDICGGYRIFDRVSFDDNGHRIRIDGTDFSPQTIVYHSLKGCEQVAAVVCTAGAGVEQWSTRMMAAGDPFRAFVADVLGSVAVEAAMDAIQQRLRDEAAVGGLKITNRYSPGYCGWSTGEQHQLFGLLPEENCGIRLTESALMQPVKSVSGLIGIGTDARFNPYTCRMCDAAFCVYRNSKH